MEEKEPPQLPPIVTEYIDSVIRHMRYGKKVRQEVREELAAHFTDALANCQTPEERSKCSETLIAEFGNPKLLGILLRRAKKRCRPLWRKTILFTGKLFAILILLLVLRVGYMASGRPTIRVDYVQWLNEQVRDGRDESLNAYHDYMNAFELMSEKIPPEISQFESTPDAEKTPEDWRAIEDFLIREAEAIAAFRKGADKPFFWNIYRNEDQPEDEIPSLIGTHGFVSGLLPQLTQRKKLARRISFLQIPYDLHTGNHKQAVDDLIRLLRYSQHLSNRGTVIEQLVGKAILYWFSGNWTNCLSC